MDQWHVLRNILQKRGGNWYSRPTRWNALITSRWSEWCLNIGRSAQHLFGRDALNSWATSSPTFNRMGNGDSRVELALFSTRGSRPEVARLKATYTGRVHENPSWIQSGRVSSSPLKYFSVTVIQTTAKWITLFNSPALVYTIHLNKIRVFTAYCLEKW